jgi:transcriptional regulator with XRE-family HTH domain
MNGLEYILALYNYKHTDLAEQLGIKKQNINMWIKGKQNIPKKHLPKLENIFGIDVSYFNKELSDIEKLEIQKEKLINDLKPVVESSEKIFTAEEKIAFIEQPVYDKEEINKIERDIEKTKLISQFKAQLESAERQPFMETYKLLMALLENAQQEPLFHKTILALAHYLEVVPEKITTDEEQSEFENEIFEVFDENNY